MIKDENVRSFIKKELPEVQGTDSMTFGGIVEYVTTLFIFDRPFANSS